MNKQARKQKQRLKRQKKQDDLRKQRNQSPVQILKAGEGSLRFYMTQDWKRFRQATVFCLREVRGRHLMAGFLVDQGVAGLKDAWAETDLAPSDFMEMLDRACDEQIKVAPCSADEARRLVAGAIRFAHDNGFRLPREMDKALKIIDGVGDWHEADVSDFVLEFVGSTADLRARCIGQTPESFLERKDVRIVIHEGLPSLLDEEEDAAEMDAIRALVDEMDPELQLIAERLADNIARWSGEEASNTSRVAMYFHLISLCQVIMSPGVYDEVVNSTIDAVGNVIGLTSEQYNEQIEHYTRYVAACPEENELALYQVTDALKAARERLNL